MFSTNSDPQTAQSPSVSRGFVRSLVEVENNEEMQCPNYTADDPRKTHQS
jgi:hypothetical protein